MNKIIEQVQSLVREKMAEYLPDVPSDQLEEGGKIYYMNGRNGTVFDWHDNEQFPPFMVFYKGGANLGAAKLILGSTGDVRLFLYGDRGRSVVKELETSFNVDETELLKLAVCLTVHADDEDIFDEAIDRIDSDADPDEDAIEEFKSVEEDNDDSDDYDAHDSTTSTQEKLAFVSKKITEEGWKVGYMIREEDEGEDERLSGWQFFAGNEDAQYLDQEDNVTLCPVGSIVCLDPAVSEHLAAAPGASFVRVSADAFEEDCGQTPFMEQRKQ